MVEEIGKVVGRRHVIDSGYFDIGIRNQNLEDGPSDPA
jgi:hypothetical protein